MPTKPPTIDLLIPFLLAFIAVSTIAIGSCRQVKGDGHPDTRHGGKYGHHHQIDHEMPALLKRIKVLEAKLKTCACAAAQKDKSHAP